MKQILVLDEHEITELYKEIIFNEFPDVQVDSTSSESEALELLTSRDYDLIIIEPMEIHGNLSRSHLDWPENCRDIFSSNVPKIVTTSLSETLINQYGYFQGKHYDAYFAKPFDSPSFLKDLPRYSRI